jgi:uncharacterized protein YoxC
MINTSQDVFWILLAISILLTAGFLSFVLYRVGKITEEAQKTVKDINIKLKKLNPLLDEGIPAVNSLIESLQQLNKGIIKPVLGLGGTIAGITSILKKWKHFGSQSSNNKGE